jgi:hypothetical protein
VLFLDVPDVPDGLKAFLKLIFLRRENENPSFLAVFLEQICELRSGGLLEYNSIELRICYCTVFII